MSETGERCAARARIIHPHADHALRRRARRDTAGQERYKGLAPMYYRNANCAVVVYDITQPVRARSGEEDSFTQSLTSVSLKSCPLPPTQQSLEKAKAWIRELQRQADPNVIIALAGNKADLASTRRGVPREDAQKYAEEEGLVFLETSAKDSSNVSELFTMLARKLAVEQAATAQRRSGAAGAQQQQQRAGGGVDLRGQQAGGGGQDACNC